VILPRLAIILNASANVTPVQRNDCGEQMLSKDGNKNGGRVAILAGERE